MLLVMLLGFAESARVDPANRLAPSVIARNYLRVLMHPLCLGYILVNAAAFGALFAYVSGPSLFLINVVGLRLEQYGLVFAATSLGIMGAALSTAGWTPGASSPAIRSRSAWDSQRFRQCCCWL
jgi:MFS transporter, DHA1 family, multidrug resistance protein